MILKADLIAVGTLGSLLFFGILFEVWPLNGTSEWSWQWRSLNLLQVALLFWMPLLLILACLREQAGSTPRRRAAALGILTACSFALQIAGIWVEHRGLSLMRDIVASPTAGGHYSDAARIDGLLPWLSEYPGVRLELRSLTQPAGPILYFYFWIKVAGTAAAPWAGALGLGALASLGVPALYHLASRWTEDVRGRLTACALYALLPSLIHFFPGMDQMLPPVAMLLMLAWRKALEGRRPWAVLFGVLVFLATVLTTNLWGIGLFLVMQTVYTMLRAERSGNDGESWKRIGLATLVAVVVPTGLILLLWWSTGYNPVAALVRAMKHQAEIGACADETYGWCVLHDLYDFMLGAGFIAIPLAFGLLRDSWKSLSWESEGAVSSYLGAATILLVAASGVLRPEAARTWLFLQPLLVIPAALQLAKQPPGRVQYVLVVQWLMLVVLKTKMLFVPL
jgi:hypothetical protein